jgi:hypothetical protein
MSGCSARRGYVVKAKIASEPPESSCRLLMPVVTANLPVMRENPPCYRQKISLLFFLCRRVKKPKPEAFAVGEPHSASA